MFIPIAQLFAQTNYHDPKKGIDSHPALWDPL